MYHSLPVACQDSQWRQSDRHSKMKKKKFLQAHFDLLYDLVHIPLEESRLVNPLLQSLYFQSIVAIKNALEIWRGVTTEEFLNNIK